VSGHTGISPVTGKIMLVHPIGTSILLMPFYLIAKPLVCIFSWISHVPFDQRHPLFFMFMCAGMVLYAYWGGHLSLRSLAILGVDKKIAVVSVLVVIWGTILPVYMFKRPIFTPIPQFFLISMLLYYILKWQKSICINFKQLFGLSVLCGGILITRWNDLPMTVLAVYFLLFSCSFQEKSFKKKILPFPKLLY